MGFVRASGVMAFSRDLFHVKYEEDFYCRNQYNKKKKIMQGFIALEPCCILRSFASFLFSLQFFLLFNIIQIIIMFCKYFYNVHN